MPPGCPVSHKTSSPRHVSVSFKPSTHAGWRAFQTCSGFIIRYHFPRNPPPRHKSSCPEAAPVLPGKGRRGIHHIISTNMSTLKAYTFKCTDTMQHAVQGIMDDWNLDRTSVIKLALYMLSAYMSKEETRRLDLYGLVEDLEKQAPPHYPRYADFGS